MKINEGNDRKSRILGSLITSIEKTKCQRDSVFLFGNQQTQNSFSKWTECQTNIRRRKKISKTRYEAMCNVSKLECWLNRSFRIF